MPGTQSAGWLRSRGWVGCVALLALPRRRGRSDGESKVARSLSYPQAAAPFMFFEHTRAYLIDGSISTPALIY
ncbi:hypothetical protein PICMEDRAFT_15447 [Pichia membranifaciens NRRL Y-2026]|uniref:Uncharacterized protein n=1 Tax=Pichia membranifaciens NRRL Y-2026 TaxID=763406 RepID=A0A1E3NN22_9ASCO|nr:hypothetical protein PICMEDRAFT_15447 [Pichia membranifaciens NRRL Y-2026]ODQ47506.1 hypothetical protein PICMEDRAFT_15447 [Pichia membranifaciens NRRL Y-2026]